MKTLLIAAAHPDDAELMCYGTIKKYAEQGYACHLLLATRGEQAAGGSEGGRADRISETKEAFKDIGMEIICLNFQDGFLKQDCLLMTNLQMQIEAINPTLIITHHPDDIGLEHQDHGVLSRATFSAAIRYGGRLQKFLFAEPLFSNFSTFKPNLFINIDKYFEDKKRILKCHASQEKKFYIDEKYIEMRARSVSPYICTNNSRFDGKYELFYQAYAVEA